jgi:hypothetical protein
MEKTIYKFYYKLENDYISNLEGEFNGKKND